MSKRVHETDVFLDDEEEEEEVPALTDALWTSIAERVASVRGLFRYAQTNRLNDRIAGRVFRTLFERDILANASAEAPQGSIFSRLAQDAAHIRQIAAEADDAAWRKYMREVLAPAYLAAVREVAEGMYEALRILAVQAEADARADMQEAQAQQWDVDTTYREEYEALLSLRTDGPIIACFTIGRSWEGWLHLDFSRQQAGEATPEEMAFARLEAVLAEHPSARLLINGGNALHVALVDLFMMLMLGHSPRLALLLTDGPARRVSMDTWGTLAHCKEEEEEEEEEPLANTFLADFERSLHDMRSEGGVVTIRSDTGPYNYIKLRLGDHVMQVRQTALDYDPPAVSAGVCRIDLGTKNGKGLSSNVLALRAMGWSDTTKLQSKLGVGLMMSPTKTRHVGLFLRNTLRLMADILNEAAAAQQTIVLISCSAGLERSLILFNLISYSIAVVSLFRSGWTRSRRQVAQMVETRLSTSRPTVGGTRKEIHNELILAAIENIPHLFEILLSV
jgi:hypothetical protein